MEENVLLKRLLGSRLPGSPWCCGFVAFGGVGVRARGCARVPVQLCKDTHGGGLCEPRAGVVRGACVVGLGFMLGC
jgi:hypothetical protein